jgi:hypothetical protein
VSVVFISVIVIHLARKLILISLRRLHLGFETVDALLEGTKEILTSAFAAHTAITRLIDSRQNLALIFESPKVSLVEVHNGL